MKKSILVLMLVCIIVVGMFAGCTSNGNDNKENANSKNNNDKVNTNEENDEEMKIPSELTLYTYYADSAIVTKDYALEQLKEKYPDLTINIEHRIDSDGSVLKTKAAVGELPDMFECVGQLTDIFVESKDILPLDEIIEETGFFDKFISSAFTGKQHSDGHYYAIAPELPNPCLMYYNKDVFSELGLEEPTHFDELMDVVKTLNENDIIPLALFAQQKWPGLQMYDMAVVGQGQPLGLMGLEDGTTKITDPEYLKAAEKINALVNAGLVGNGAMNTNASQAFELLKTSQAGLLVNGTWYFKDALEYGDSIGYIEYNPFADEDMKEEIKGAMSGGAPASGGYAVSAKGEYAEFSKQVLLDFLYYNAIANTKLTGEVSPLVEEIKPDSPRYESYEKFANSVKDIKSLSKYEWSLNSQELIVALEDTTEKLIITKQEPANFVKELDNLIKSALAE